MATTHAAGRLILAAVLCCRAAASEAGIDPQDVTVDAGRPLRVALDTRVRVKQEGETVTGTLQDET